MIKLKSLYEIRIQKPLRLNAKGQELMNYYDQLERVCKIFGVDISDEGNDNYDSVWSLKTILDDSDYSNNGITSISQIKQYLIDMGNEEDDLIEPLNNILQYFS